MPRTRSIKPEFWDDEKLSTICRDARLTYLGLWTNSDDYGVVKGNPIYLKSKIYPYDEDLELSEFGQWLKALEEIGCIRAFQSNGEKYYYIRKFLTHQSISHPAKRVYPEPPESLQSESVKLPSDSGVAPDDYGNPPFETETETETETEEGDSQNRRAKPGRSLPSPQDFVDLWNEKTEDLPKVRELTPTRERHIRQRLKERSLEEWGAIIERINRTPFLLGENDRSWKATLNWLVKSPDPGVKVLEGFYDNHRNRDGPTGDDELNTLKKCRRCGKFTAESVTIDRQRQVFKRVCQHPDCRFEETLEPAGRGPPK